jgi:hypothetical protein
MEAQRYVVPVSTSRFNAVDIRRYVDEKAQNGSRSGSPEDAELSSVSLTSTLIHQQEPFETFRRRVRQLCAAEFSNATVHIERLRGGTYNRITAITVTPSPPRTLSIPWMRSFIISREDHDEAQKSQRYILKSP